MNDQEWAIMVRKESQAWSERLRKQESSLYPYRVRWYRYLHPLRWRRMQAQIAQQRVKPKTWREVQAIAEGADKRLEAARIEDVQKGLRK